MARRRRPTAARTRRPPGARWSRGASCAPTGARNAARLEKTAPPRVSSLRRPSPLPRRPPMFKIANAQLWVHDQDEALDFYTKKLGMEVRSDVTVAEMGNFRWLSVGPAGQPDIAIVLMAIPGPPVFEPETAEQVKGLTATGAAGTIFLTTDDVRASFEELKGRGVEFVEEPQERPYGIDAALRDPSGNSIRVTQPRTGLPAT